VRGGELAFETIDDIEQTDSLVRAITPPNCDLVQYARTLEPL
jgi:hypothetical protein